MNIDIKQKLRYAAFSIGTLTVILTASACARPQATAGTIVVEIVTSTESTQHTLPSGSTVQEALNGAGFELGTLDRVDPPGYTVLSNESVVTIVRVVEEFEIENETIPFPSQTVRNEALPEGETLLIQPGENGVQEITFRIVIEEGQEVARSPVKTVIIKEAIPEIIMIGTQASFTPVPIEGSLVYIAGGNVWLIEGNTGNRRAIIVSGDIDGRILKISPDGRWLLFTRSLDDEEGTINSLWAYSLADSEIDEVELDVENVIHFADWVPNASVNTITYSTVEPSPSPPGWQANNDLKSLTLSDSGRVGNRETILEANSGGQYGWWGTDFAWGWNRHDLAYMRADSIGLVDIPAGEIIPIYDIVPFQTLGDWAWVPGLSWSQDGQNIYYVDHGAPVGIESPQASPVFNLSAGTTSGTESLELVDRTGMFAYPSVSPRLDVQTAEIAFNVAFLQAIAPLESGDSTYRLTVMDRDGSDLRALFPPEGETGLQPDEPVWSPDGQLVAVIYRGDLWIVEVGSGIGNRLTGDAQTTGLDWN